MVIRYHPWSMVTGHILLLTGYWLLHSLVATGYFLEVTDTCY
jgi:hypothetical protein